MHKDIFTPLVFNEPVALTSVEPFDGTHNSFRHNTVVLLVLTTDVEKNRCHRSKRFTAKKKSDRPRIWRSLQIRTDTFFILTIETIPGQSFSVNSEKISGAFTMEAAHIFESSKLFISLFALLTQLLELDTIDMQIC